MKHGRRFLAALTALLALSALCACRAVPPVETITTGPAAETTTQAQQTTTEVQTTASEPETDAAQTTAAAQPADGPAAEPSVPGEPSTNPPGTTSKGFSIAVVDGITYVDGILIANKTYALPRDYDPGELTDDTYAAYTRMKEAAAEDGIYLEIVSGFRSYDLQTSLYNRYVASDGKAAADRYSARPGHSEHQSGYAMDLNSLTQAFADTAEGRWIAANCHKYGFILRYPKGKEEQTGYMYEPWHVRYVGEARAAAIYESGLCLEEYYGITSVYQ